MKTLITKGIRTRCLLIPAVFFSFSFYLNGQPVSQTFNSSGTYTVPAGYSANVTIEAWGAGGGGGSNTNGAKGGGGGGAYASSTTTLSAGNYTVTVGTGGGNGTAGGNSNFTTLVIAEGGSSTTNGTGGNGGTTAGSTGTTKVAGVNGANNSSNNGGAGGAGGNGGGAGGAGGPANNGNGTAGTAPGGGGGGKAGPGGGGLSGAGADGRVIVTVNIVLPVKISGFRVFEKNNGIQIDWTAYGELNMDKYKVERSANGINFFVIGEIPARQNAPEILYTFFDTSPLTDNNFYRIKAVDLDGRAGYTPVIKINLNRTGNEITLYPSPVKGGYLSLQASYISKGNLSVRIFTASGQLVQTEKFYHSGGAISLSMRLSSTVQKGVYLLQLDNEEGRIAAKRFIAE